VVVKYAVYALYHIIFMAIDHTLFCKRLKRYASCFRLRSIILYRYNRRQDKIIGKEINYIYTNPATVLSVRDRVSYAYRLWITRRQPNLKSVCIERFDRIYIGFRACSERRRRSTTYNVRC